jgi:hypothetical protein
MKAQQLRTGKQEGEETEMVTMFSADSEVTYIHQGSLIL